MQKILYIIRNMAVGGSETSLLAVLKKLDKREFQVDVLSIYEGGALQLELENIGVKTYVMRFKSFHDIASYFRLIRFIRRNKYDIIHTKLFHADIVGRICGRIAGTPKIFSTIGNAHEWEVEGTWKQKLKCAVFRLSSKANTRIFAVSKNIRSLLTRKVGIDEKSVEVMYNGVDLSEFDVRSNSMAEVRTQLGLPRDVHLVGAVGTLNQNKNHRLLIEAASRVLRERQDVFFVFVGRGDQSQLRTLASTLGVLEHILFLGLRRDIRDILNALDIYVITSLSEGLSNSLIEAMAMSKPVIATSVGGNPEIINDPEVGILIPVNRPDLLAEHILDLLANPDKAMRYGENARKRVMQEFDLNLTVSRHEAFYRAPVVGR